MDSIRQISVKDIVIGSGAAGYSAAIRLNQFKRHDIAIITENVNAGTSRNTGSDKQTYYKLSIAGNNMDSVQLLTQNLFDGQCVDGDIALCEASLSTRMFYYLVELGVPFPCDKYDEFIGYKTDHDTSSRATSAGPYTSKIMTECLEREAKRRNISVLNGFQAIKLLVRNNMIYGVLCLDKSNDNEYVIIWCENVIMATGGPACIYKDSVYPQSQTGNSGMAFEVGVKGKNLTEWQFGMASKSPRWNVSGTYMQVIPRFVSTKKDGTDEREFLYDYFENKNQLMSLIFLKGYQWPFDTNKIYGGSSIIDILVYIETIIKNRKVFLDYRSNTQCKDIQFSLLSEEAYQYLKNGNACFGTPIERLKVLNEPAIKFYAEHGVDLYNEMLEIAVCAQHNNGGLLTDNHWQTNIKGLFAIGEVSGTHGVTRPGGTALNAGQVGAYRAADYIANLDNTKKQYKEEFKKDILDEVIKYKNQVNFCNGKDSLSEIWLRASKRMSSAGGMVRNFDDIKKAIIETQDELENLIYNLKTIKKEELSIYYKLKDMLICQKVYLSAMLDYIKHGVGSRGSAIYTDEQGEKPIESLSDIFKCKLDNKEHSSYIQEVYLKDNKVETSWRKVRDIPDIDIFFENQWKEYRKRYSI